MKRNGFTLIELLAVIVILAIIALIATPIILGIINDAREESNERSVELYASAVRNAVASYQLKGTSAPKSFSDLDVQYDGVVECATEILYADGSFYIADCTVNGDTVDYTYGKKQQKYKPQYYAKDGFIGKELPNDAKANASELDTSGQPFYVGLDVDSNNIVTSVYGCFKRNETEYCIKPEDNDIEKIVARDKDVLEDAFEDVDNACSFTTNRFNCEADGVVVSFNDNLYICDNDGMTCIHFVNSGWSWIF